MIESLIRSIRGDMMITVTTKHRQQALLRLGYTIAVDGMWGPKSKGTLSQFQIDYSLPVTGFWDDETDKKVKHLLSGQT
jgi:N-acetyl-anhydromuramyl-L-alanine amidase AmpD